MGALLILGIFTGLLFLACHFADRPADEPDDGFVQAVHCRPVTPKEPTRP